MTNRLAVMLGVVGLVLLPGAAHAFDRAGTASVSANVGAVQYLADESSSDGASPRFAIQVGGEYSPSTSLTLRIATGGGWVSYGEDKSPGGDRFGEPKPVKIVAPTTFSIIRRFGGDAERQFYAGTGIGLYFWRFRINGKTQRDPVTFERVQSSKVGSFDFGLHGLVGYEYPLSESIALTGEADIHYVLSANDTDRPDKPDGSEFADYPEFNGNDMLATARVGVKMYFSLERFEKPEPEYEPIPE